MLTYDLQVINTRAAALEADLVQKSEELKKYQHQLFEVYLYLCPRTYIYDSSCVYNCVPCVLRSKASKQSKKKHVSKAAVLSLVLLCIVLKSGELKMYQQFPPPFSKQLLLRHSMIHHLYDVIY